MRILILPAVYPAGASDFAGAFIGDQAAVIATRHDVTVAAPRLLSLRRILSRRAAPSCPAAAGGSRSVSVINVRIPNLTNRWERLTFAAWRHFMGRALARRFDADPPDLIHAHFVRPAGTVAAALARRWGIPALLTEHSGPFAVQLRTRWMRRESLAALRSVDHILAVSPALRDAITAEFPELRPSVLGNVLDDSFFVPGPTRAPAAEFRFLFVGSLVPVKGLDILLKAAADLMARAPAGWRLDVVGGGPLRRALGRAAAGFGLGSRVAFRGPLDRPGVLRAMQAADALVLPSRTETFGVVSIEAMACGVPVIASACGGPSWVVDGASGVLVPPEDSRLLADAMLDLLTGRIRFSRVEARASAVGRFGRRTWLDQYEAIVRRLTESRRPPGAAPG